MIKWYKKNFAHYTEAREYADRKEACGCLAVITNYLHGWTVSWGSRL